MSGSNVVVKTPGGIAELKSRSRSLPLRLRTMLIMIDGNLNVVQLQTAAAALGVTPDFLDILQRQGLIAFRASGKPAAVPAEVSANAPPVDRFRAAQKFMNDTVVDALGFRAFFFTLKLEKCFTLGDLNGLLEDYHRRSSRAAARKWPAPSRLGRASCSNEPCATLRRRHHKLCGPCLAALMEVPACTC